jgi:hypothetical protein
VDEQPALDDTAFLNQDRGRANVARDDAVGQELGTLRGVDVPRDRTAHDDFAGRDIADHRRPFADDHQVGAVDGAFHAPVHA